MMKLSDEKRIEELEQRVENLENAVEDKIDEKIEQVDRPSNIDRYAKDYAISKLKDLKEEIGVAEEQDA